MSLRSGIRKFDDFSRECIKKARFLKLWGLGLAEQWHDGSAREDFYVRPKIDAT